MLTKLKSAMMTQAMKLMTDPKVMKLLSNPKVTQLIMQGLALKGKAEAFWSAQSRVLARQLNLATREEIAELEAEIEALRDRLAASKSN